MSQVGFRKATPFSWVSVYFFSYFFVFSYFLPFWAPWLDSRGVNSEEIGLILGGSLIIRCLSNLFVATRLTNLTYLVNGLRALALGMLVSMIIAFLCGSNVWLLALMTLVFSAFLAPAVPLSDVLAIRYVCEKQLDYGKSRLWGSAGFLIGTLISGYAFETLGPDAVLWMMIAGTAGMFLHSLKKPTPGLTIPEAGHAPTQWSVIKVLADREVLWMLLVTSMIYGSHAALYGFSVLYWTEQGIEPSVIGYLWAMGVSAEIVLFNFSWRLTKKFSVKDLLIIASMGVAIRWAIMASTVQIEWLFFAQILHAFTFGVCHIAVSTYIQKKPQGMTVPLQAIYNAVPNSAAIAVMTVITGFYFDSLQGGIFWGMAAMGVGALLLCMKQPKPQQYNEAVAQD